MRPKRKRVSSSRPAFSGNRPQRRTAGRGSPLNRAFTLIEIMIVVSIMGIVMATSVPIVYKVWRKSPMRDAVKDIVEVCSHARARAIMQGTITEVVFHPKENRLELVGGGGAPHSANASGGQAPFSATATTGSGVSAQLSNQIIIETLDINMSGVEFNDYDQVAIRFYPNGISDEMRMILFDGRDRMGIELEITTGLANVVHDPLREWARR
jgi:prepilin-type N-terminal cleavage/methylation domain-containing protein